MSRHNCEWMGNQTADKISTTTNQKCTGTIATRYNMRASWPAPYPSLQHSFSTAHTVNSFFAPLCRRPRTVLMHLPEIPLHSDIASRPYYRASYMPSGLIIRVLSVMFPHSAGTFAVELNLVPSFRRTRRLRRPRGHGRVQRTSSDHQGSPRKVGELDRNSLGRWRCICRSSDAKKIA